MIYGIKGEGGRGRYLTSRENYSCRSTFFLARQPFANGIPLPLNRFNFPGVSTDPARVIATLKSSPSHAAPQRFRARYQPSFSRPNFNANSSLPSAPPLPGLLPPWRSAPGPRYMFALKLSLLDSEESTTSTITKRLDEERI